MANQEAFPQYFSTVAQMQAWPPLASITVDLLGEFAAFDNLMGGRYFYDATSTLTPDGNTVVSSNYGGNWRKCPVT